MNLILENTREVEYYTSLKIIEKWMEIELSDYDWHFSDIEGGWGIQDPSWITGQELKSKIHEYDYQFVWAVISAYPLGTKPKLNPNPYADGNPDFWTASAQKQLEDALFEIVCWDGSATLFIGLPDELGVKICKNAPGIKNLDEFNIFHN
ncbi:hypothetical protein [Aquimarina rhabdastrellae]